MQNILSTPVTRQPQTTMMQGFATPVQVNQSYIGQPQVMQTVQDPIMLDPIPIVDQSYTSAVVMNQGAVTKDCSYRLDPNRVEFGKIKGVEVLTFKEAELEKTLGGRTTFATVGNLSVLYFADYDRFVLSVNDWKYALLRRLPIVSTEPTLTGPVSYTLPTYNGFYTLTINKISHVEALKNFETILLDNSRYSISSETTPLRQEILSTSYGVSGPTVMQGSGIPTTGLVQGSGLVSNNVLASNAGLTSGPGLTSTYLPNQGLVGGQTFIPGQSTLLNQSGIPGQEIYNGQEVVLGPEGTALSQIEHAHPGPLKATQRIKRGFKKFAFMVTKGLVTPNKQNLNLYQPRDIYNIKRTSEVMAPIAFFPRKEVERWISFNKEIAQNFGFEPENYADPNTIPLGQTSPLGGDSYGRMRGYGSVDLGQGSLSNPVDLDAITSARKPNSYLIGSTVGPSGRNNYGGYTVPSSMDKFKSKVAGHHHYKGEKTGEHLHPHQSLSGPREMTITQGQVVSTTLASSYVQNNTIQENENPTVVQRLEERFTNEQPIEQVYVNEPIVQGNTVNTGFASAQPIHVLEEGTQPGLVTEIVGQETYIQERPSLTQRIETGIMNESLGVQNLSATFGNQGVTTENIVNGTYTQEGAVQNIQTTPSILQRVENRIAGLENPPVQYTQSVTTTQTIPNAGIRSENTLNRDIQNPTLMDKMKGLFRSRKPAEEGQIPPEQLEKLRGDGTLYHYQA